MRVLGTVVALALVSACSPQIPDSAAGVGFDNSPQAQRAREAALAHGTSVSGDPLIPAGVMSSETIAPGASQQMPLTAGSSSTGDAADIAQATAAALSASSGNAAGASDPDNPGLSDENDFSAVTARRSIQEDAAQIERNKASYQQVQPTPLPARNGAATPNIVAYALGTSNPVGNRIYSRSGFNLEAKARRNCAKYPSPDQAQIAFLAAGGPERDRHGLDPDGDGYACGWDPAPFRMVRN